MTYFLNLTSRATARFAPKSLLIINLVIRMREVKREGGRKSGRNYAILIMLFNYTLIIIISSSMYAVKIE